MNKNIIPAEIIENRIFLIRKQKVMLDMHLAELYGVTTSALNQAVKRNSDRFPKEFMFQLTKTETELLISQNAISNSTTNSSRSQFVILNRGKNIKYLPYVFTEQGVAMLSSVLKSKRAIQVNVLIMKTFVKIRELMATHIDLAQKIEELDKKYGEHDQKIQAILKIIKGLLAPPESTEPEPEKPPMGFYMPPTKTKRKPK
jgi:hypothetical protein